MSNLLRYLQSEHDFEHDLKKRRNTPNLRSTMQTVICQNVGMFIFLLEKLLTLLLLDFLITCMLLNILIKKRDCNG